MGKKEKVVQLKSPRNGKKYTAVFGSWQENSWFWSRP